MSMTRYLLLILMTVLVLGFPDAGLASEATHTDMLNLTSHWWGYSALLIFVLAYALVMAEEFTHLRKSKPVLLAAGIIWIGIAWIYNTHGFPHAAEIAIRHNILEFAELFLFLLVAMTYINAMEERQVFETLRAKLVCSGMTYRQLFWITGLLSFFISPLADNLTTALLMCAVVMALGKDRPGFIGLACINIVVAANAGGAFSPFGDITTLMVWQKGIVQFQTFFALFVPSVVNWIVPAFIMSFAIPKDRPATCEVNIGIKRGGKIVMVLFGLTIVTAVSFHNFFHLPPMAGMMMGLSYLKIFGF